MVVKRGVNDTSVAAMARHFRGSGHILRFIEYMDVGHTNGWRMDDVVTAKEIVGMINAEAPLEQCDPNYRGEVAERWRYRDGRRIATRSVSVRSAAIAHARVYQPKAAYTCLFATAGHPLKPLLRGGASDDEINAGYQAIWRARRPLFRDPHGANCRTPKSRDVAMEGG